MKNLYLAILSFFTLTLANTTIAAPESPFTVGILLGESTLDIQSHDYDAHDEDLDTPGSEPITSDFEAQDSQGLSLLFTAGYSFLDWLAIELQYTTRLQGDEVYGKVRNSSSPDVDTNDYSTMEISTSAAGVYAVFQAGSEVFAKARFGIGNSTAEFKTDFATESYSSTHLSYGASVGQQFGIGSLELLFMHYPDVEISRQKFEGVFYSADGTNTGVTVRRRCNNEILSVGYVFTF